MSHAVIISVSCLLSTGTYYRLFGYLLSIVHLREDILKSTVSLFLCVMAGVASHRWQRKCTSKRGKKARCKRSLSTPAVLHTPEKPKRKCWTDCQMKAAMEAVAIVKPGFTETRCA